MYYQGASWVSNLTMNELNVVLVYGIGIFILVVVPVVVIAGYELKQIKQSNTGGIDAIVSGVMKTFIYSLLFLFFVMLVVMALIGMSNTTINPAFGVEGFFKVEWLDTNVMTAISTGKIAGLGDPQKLESAKSMVAILTIARFTYILLLMTFFLVMMTIANGVAFSDHKKSNDDSSASFMMKLFIASVVSLLVFDVLMTMISQVLNAMVYFSDTVQGTSYESQFGKINIIKDFVSLFNIGLNYASTHFN